MRLKCHQPTESLDILSIHNDIDVNIRYVRMLSHTYLNQFDEVFRLLEITLAPHNQKGQIPKIPYQLVIYSLFLRSQKKYIHIIFIPAAKI